jgi:hypothetical protein
VPAAGELGDQPLELLDLGADGEDIALQHLDDGVDLALGDVGTGEGDFFGHFLTLGGLDKSEIRNQKSEKSSNGENQKAQKGDFRVLAFGLFSIFWFRPSSFHPVFYFNSLENGIVARLSGPMSSDW